MKKLYILFFTALLLSGLNGQDVSKAEILKSMNSAGYSQDMIMLAVEKPVSASTLETLVKFGASDFSKEFYVRIITDGIELSEKEILDILDLKMSGIDESLILMTLPAGTTSKATKDNSDKPVILVLDFENNTRLDNVSLGPGVADIMTTALLENGNFRVVERGETLKRILDEHALHQTGLVSSASAATIGNLVGATHVITGKVTEFGIRKTSAQVGFILGGAGKKKITARVVMDARMVKVETAEAIKAASGEGEASTEVSAGAALPISMEVGTIGFDETTIGQATRKAILMVVTKISDQ